MDRMLKLFEVERDRHDVPADVFPTGLVPFICKIEDGSGHEVVMGYGVLPDSRTSFAASAIGRRVSTGGSGSGS